MDKMNRDMQITSELEWSGDALDRLGEIQSALNVLAYMRDEAITECRTGQPTIYTEDIEFGGETVTRIADGQRPIPWAKIAEQLGVSRQTAWQRYRHLD